MQNILWWECEDFPDTKYWTITKLSERLASMTRRLVKHIQDKKLPQYFEPKFNLLELSEAKHENFEQEKKNIDEFCKDPMSKLLRAITKVRPQNALM